ncbi:MAG: N-acetyltransferase [Nitrospirota bacterium]
MIRKAKLEDVKKIHHLIMASAKANELLPRSLHEIYEDLRDFFVYEEDGKIIGVSAIHVCWEDLAEIRSLAVTEEYRMKGIGKILVQRCLEDAKDIGISRVFALTYHPDFFEKMGFKRVDKSKLPQKIWGDCLKCPKFPECNEVAVIKKL